MLKSLDDVTPEKIMRGVLYSVKKSIKAIWGISEVGFSLMATMETAFLVFFLTDVARLPLAIVAIITGFSALADAFSAILAGIVIDKVTFKKGKYRQWLLICPPLVTFFFLFCYTKIGGDVTAGLIIGIGYILSHFVWNICWTANRNLIPVITTDPKDRAFLSSRLGVGSNVGKICSSFAVPFLKTAFIVGLGSAIASPVTAYTITAVILCLVFWICYYIHYFITKGYDTVDKGAKPATFGAMAKGIAINPPLISFLLHDAIRLIAYYCSAATAAYFCKVCLNNANLSATMLLFFYAGGVVGGLLTRTFVKKFGTKKTTFIGMIGWLIFQALCMLLPNNIIYIGISLLIAQISFGITYGQTANYYTMCGAYGEWKTGENTRGVIMAFCSLAIKCAVALRGVIIAAALAAIAYDAKAKVFSDAMVSGIKNVFILIPVICILVSLVPLIFFKLNDQKVTDMENEIASRKANEKSA